MFHGFTQRWLRFAPMPYLAKCRHSGWFNLPVVIVVGIIARVVSSLLQGDTVSALPGVFDQISYDALARQVLAGHGFTAATGTWPSTGAGEPTSFWSFLYTIYLAGVYALVGVHPLAARLIQSIAAGVLHPWLTMRIGTRAFGSRAGLLAAAFVAVYTYFVYYAGSLISETLYLLTILWVLDIATRIVYAQRCPRQDSTAGRWGNSGGFKLWLLLGLALGLSALLRQVILLFVPFLFIWLGWALLRKQVRAVGLNRSEWRSLVLRLVIVTVVLTAMILPWTVRNYQTFGRFVLLNTNAGYAFFWANHPIYGTDFVPTLPGNVYRALIPPELRDLDEAAMDQALLVRGLAIVAEDPVRYVELSLSRVGVFFQFWPTPESGSVSNIARLFSFGVALPFMLSGMFWSIARRRRDAPSAQRETIVLLYLFVFAYSLAHVLSWSLIRYRQPVDAVLLLFAGLAISDLTGWMTKRYAWTTRLPQSLRNHQCSVETPRRGR